MAVGDVISGIFTTIGVQHDFQPSAGTEIIITAVLGSNGNLMNVGLYDGVTASTSYIQYNTYFAQNANVKIGINNTNYLRVFSNGGTPPSYTGIQIK
jgi:hypothetical protein